jgi:hypothetical protein
MKRPPILSEEDIESHATELLAEYTRRTGEATQLPIPIELIIDHVLDIPIEWEPLLSRDGQEIASKITEPCYGNPCRIVMNEDYLETKFREHPGLIETVMGHEAGHGRLHIEHGNVHQMMLPLTHNAVFTTKAESLTDCLGEALRRRGPVDDEWWREWQAHTFMRFALMPRKMLLAAMSETGYRTWPQLYALRERCNVTISALVVHLEKLRIIRVEGGRIYDAATQPSLQRVLGS